MPSYSTESVASGSTDAHPQTSTLSRVQAMDTPALDHRRRSAPIAQASMQPHATHFSSHTSRPRVASVSEEPSTRSQVPTIAPQSAQQRFPSDPPQLTRQAGPSSMTLGHYQLGDCLGRGAFGSVYRGLNWTTGETVAVKQIQLAKIPKSELGEIMSEIDLLKNLKHPNIVKYKGSEKTKDFLYIILEYCENGSLQHICKRFGKFPEGLVSVYISQVLQGLIYLHDQGVIHRDIKGANILTTKDGSVKLADFGVATKTGAMSDYAVVGSPYWMAPEVIDQSGATTASDIWSVGCVVVELLQGKPPYHFLAPMPALFRIVQDDCPPLPEGASPIVKDFLLHCFQKDANLRVTARKLLRHPWMISARKQLERLSTGGSVRLGDTIKTTHEEAVKSVREWNQALEKPAKPTVKRSTDIETVRASLQPSLRRVTGTIADMSTAMPRKPRTGSRPTLPADFSPPPASRSSNTTGKTTPQPSTSAAMFSDNLNTDARPTKVTQSTIAAGATIPLAGAAPATSLMDQRTRLADLQKAEEQTDNWDNDFEEGITTTKIAALERGPSPEHQSRHIKPATSKASVSGQVFDARTIRPTNDAVTRRSTSSHSNEAKREAREPFTDSSADEEDDYSDVVADADGLQLDQRIQNLLIQNSAGKRLFHPDDLKRVAGGASKIVTSRSGDRQRQLSNGASSSLSRGSSMAMSPQSTMRAAEDVKWKQTRRALNKYSEDNSADDYSDLFDEIAAGDEQTSEGRSGNKLQLSARLSSRSWLCDTDVDEDDPFAEVDEGFNAEADLEANVARDQHARMCAFVTDLVDSLDSDASEDELLQVCEEIDQVLTDMPEMKSQLLSSHGALALTQLLEQCQDRELATRLLGILNLIIFEDPEAQESLCLIGAIPVVMMFTSKKWPHDLRLEAAHFVFAMCSTSRLTLQFVLSCRGLRTLVSLIDEDYHEQKDLVWIGVGCVSSVLELQSPASRNDFCRLLAQEGLLDPLSSALQSVLEDSNDDYATEARANILQIFLIYSQSDSYLKKQVATRSVLRRILQTAPRLDSESLKLMLKIVKNLSMSPTLLDEMQNANTIETLTTILAQHHSGPHGTEMSNQVLNTMYNMCRLSKSRQEEAAQAGIIPQLLRVARTNSPLRQFALPILCDLSHAGKATRKLFWQHKGLNFYLKLLEDPYWLISAMESILVWLQDETARVEEVLLQPSSIDALVCVFATSKANAFENLLEPLLKLCRSSSGVVLSMGRNTTFLKKLVDRLTHSKAVVRVNLLRITKMICDLQADDGAALEAQTKLYDLVDKLSRQDGAVLVRELAREILAQRSTDKEAPSPRTVRRSVSATHINGGASEFGAADSRRHGAGGSSMSPPMLPTQLVGARASTPYRRKISGGGDSSADSSAVSIAHNILHERAATGAFSPASSISSARSAAMRNLVGRLGQPRRSVTPSRDQSINSVQSINSIPTATSGASNISPRMPLDQLPLNQGAQTSQRSSTPPTDIAASKLAARRPSVDNLRQRRSINHELLDAGCSTTPSPKGAPAGLDAPDNDRTMRPPSRRPVPSLPPSHRQFAS